MANHKVNDDFTFFFWDYSFTNFNLYKGNSISHSDVFLRGLVMLASLDLRGTARNACKTHTGYEIDFS